MKFNGYSKVWPTKNKQNDKGAFCLDHVPIFQMFSLREDLNTTFNSKSYKSTVKAWNIYVSTISECISGISTFPKPLLTKRILNAC